MKSSLPTYHTILLPDNSLTCQEYAVRVRNAARLHDLEQSQHTHEAVQTVDRPYYTVQYDQSGIIWHRGYRYGWWGIIWHPRIQVRLVGNHLAPEDTDTVGGESFGTRGYRCGWWGIIWHPTGIQAQSHQSVLVGCACSNRTSFTVHSSA